MFRAVLVVDVHLLDREQAEKVYGDLTHGVWRATSDADLDKEASRLELVEERPGPSAAAHLLEEWDRWDEWRRRHEIPVPQGMAPVKEAIERLRTVETSSS